MVPSGRSQNGLFQERKLVQSSYPFDELDVFEYRDRRVSTYLIERLTVGEYAPVTETDV
jgi:hypothetical protein